MSVLSRRHSLTETIPLWRARRKCISTIKTKAQSGEAETKKEVTAFREVKALVNAHFITSFAMRLFPPTPPERCRSIAHSFLSLSLRAQLLSYQNILKIDNLIGFDKIIKLQVQRDARHRRCALGTAAAPLEAAAL